MSNIAIKVQNLSKVYKLYDKPIDRLKESLHPLKKKYHKEFYALNDVSFEIKKGETVGIIGKNGAGKSTLLKIITGVLTPSSGHVHVNGRIASLLELGAGFNPEYTGIENIYLQGTLMGYSKEEMDVKIDEILAFADIGDFVYQPVKSYSSGMFARLAFAVAINVDPDILIVDEALSVGDFAFQAKCFQRFQMFQKAGKTILFVSHSTQQIIQYCNKAMLIHGGNLIKYSDDVKQTTYDYEVLIRKHDDIVSSECLENKEDFFEEEFDFDTTANKEVNEHRFGTHEAIFRKVTLSHNKDALSTDIIFTAGEKVYLRFYIMAKRDFSSIVMGTSIKNRDGVLIWGDNTVDTAISLKKGLNKISMEFDLNVVAGEYFIDCGMADISYTPRIELDQRWPFDKISITTSHRTIQGFVFSPANINIEKGKL
ncbi:ABC transporter ATP-binding protein [Aliarcobacter butzleri]|uniref:ABC transporter ATP-binding protein n=1 Tax=Aliarcobacter butzleri TaxID=28197 RepID=UPI0021B59DA0|nr:ABC transporter ATP-binding protein [Aliarcobacter butzleri]MCT7575900.1 ABC transporter ATP-binding protein [Aliarcobacter butzleri]